MRAFPAGSAGDGRVVIVAGARLGVAHASGSLLLDHPHDLTLQLGHWLWQGRLARAISKTRPWLLPEGRAPRLRAALARSTSKGSCLPPVTLRAGASSRFDEPVLSSQGSDARPAAIVRFVAFEYWCSRCSITFKLEVGHGFPGADQSTSRPAKLPCCGAIAAGRCTRRRSGSWRALGRCIISW